MINCEILKKMEYSEYIIKVKNKIINMVLEFYGIDVNAGDILFLDEKILDKNSPEYTEPVSFRVVEKEEEKNSRENKEYAILYTSNAEIRLRRIYG